MTMQGVKVMKTIKKDDNAVVGLGKLFIADKFNGYGSVAHQARGERMKFFWVFLPFFLSTLLGDCEILLDDHLFCNPNLLLYKIVFKILDWLFKLI